MNQLDAETAYDKFLASRNKDFFSISISELVNHSQKCIDSHGLYFDL